MKANELRIGNWYDHNGKFEQTTPNTILEIWESERIWCKPIPITAEWLLKFGFIQEYYANGKYERWYKDCVYIEKTNNVFHHDFVSIGAIHQLQNLYFALTGEELEIKE